MQTSDTDISDLRDIVAAVHDKKAQKSYGIPVNTSPLEDVIGAMIDNADMHCGSHDIAHVFGPWECAADVVDVYITPNLGAENVRPLSSAEIIQLDRYIGRTRDLLSVG